ncbi:hypothetical protein QQ045_017773 [Rhodiola kirilowii]
MEWYTSDKGDDVVVPSQERWTQWVGSFDSLGKSSALRNSGAADVDFSCETLMDKLEMDCLVGEADQAENSGGVRGGIAESSNSCWTTLLNNQDYQLDGFPWTNQTDENFLSSLLADDLRASDQFQLYGSPMSQGTYSTTNNLTTDMLLDSHDTGIFEKTDLEGFLCPFNWEKKQSNASHHNLPNMMNSDVPMYTAPSGNAPQQVCASRRVVHCPSVEDAVLQEFGSTVQKMTDKTRLCFRDALYRLATNSEKHLSVQGEYEENAASERLITATVPHQTLRSVDKDVTESRTNTIDRTIADLMFNKLNQYGGGCQRSHAIGIPKAVVRL